MKLKEFWDRYDAGERNFQRINLAGEAFEYCNFNGVDLSLANLENAEFSKCNFRHSKLNSINLCQAVFYESQFIDVQLQAANLSRVSAIDLTLTRCDLKTADLTDANFGDVYFIESELSQSQWQGASWVGGATRSNLTEAALEGLEARFVELIDTVLPNGALINQTWSDQTIQAEMLSQLCTQIASSDEVAQSDFQAGERYARLAELLKARRWEDADEETASLMCQLTGAEFPDVIQGKRVAKIPCQDLLTLDQLWVEHSWGQFGFSIQNQIWRSLFSDYTFDVEKHRQFSQMVGWNAALDETDGYREYAFPAEKDADQAGIQSLPLGYLPRVELWPANYGAFIFDPGIESIYSRLSYCEDAIE